MSTRSKSDKSEVEDLYKTAIEGHKRTKQSTSGTLYTSTPTDPSKRIPKPITLEYYESESETNLSNNSSGQHNSDSDDSADITLESVDNTVKFLIDKSVSDKKISDKNISDKNISSKTTKNMAHHNPFATLKYAVEAIPFFDGKNIPLNYFIEGCEEAKTMLPSEAEEQFTKIIRTRIIGEARRTIQDQDFNSVAQLTKYLKQIYGPSKNVYQLQGELGCVYQKNEEDVVTYANRVKILGKQILEAYRSSGSIMQDQNIKASLEKDMCKCFIRGLKPEIEQRIARNLDVQGTVADALRLERELCAMTDLRQGSNNTPSQNKISAGSQVRGTCQVCYKEGHSASNCRKLEQFSHQNTNKATLGNDILICQICKKRGHGADKCRFRDPQSRQPINLIQENNTACQICSKTGHIAKSCPYNNNNNTSKNNQIQNDKKTFICQWCDRPGHLANNCWKRQNEQGTGNKSRIICQICNNFGHNAKDCRSKMNHQPMPKDNQFCRYCKENGHLLENCQLRIASNNRRKEDSQGNPNGPLKTGVQQGSASAAHPSTS